jgi:hypothetical protein
MPCVFRAGPTVKSAIRIVARSVAANIFYPRLIALGMQGGALPPHIVFATTLVGILLEHLHASWVPLAVRICGVLAEALGFYEGWISRTSRTTKARFVRATQVIASTVGELHGVISRVVGVGEGGVKVTSQHGGARRIVATRGLLG